jgi:hypothetical protein
MLAYVVSLHVGFDLFWDQGVINHLFNYKIILFLKIDLNEIKIKSEIHLR